MLVVAEEWPGPGLYTRRWGGDGQGAGAGMGGVSGTGLGVLQLFATTLSDPLTFHILFFFPLFSSYNK